MIVTRHCGHNEETEIPGSPEEFLMERGRRCRRCRKSQRKRPESTPKSLARSRRTDNREESLPRAMESAMATYGE